MTYIVTKPDGIRLPERDNPAGRLLAHGQMFEASELSDLDETKRARLLRVMVELRRIAEYDSPTEDAPTSKVEPIALKYHPVGRYELPDGRVIKGKQAALDALADAG